MSGQGDIRHGAAFRDDAFGVALAAACDDR